ncbi:hypothetical protein [Parasitella parasitica]|uniref:CCHC-type domain-containing protein n=1 Tax=Parasitella parasitica TaxID=35722 RepID=A0A0B7NX41_9FUNG|nr:hypothetical protein [Parasitella parasitica]
MSSPQTKSTTTLGKIQKASGTKPTPSTRSWSQIVSGNIFSCHSSHQETGRVATPPTSQPLKSRSGTTTTRSSTMDSKFASRTDDIFFDVITPYIVGNEANSTFIEITNVEDTHALKEFLGTYNTKDSFPFYGALLKVRKYLQRSFIETCWDTDSDVYQKLITSGLEMNKSTILKGYPSLSSDAKVQRVHVDNLPLKHPRILRDLLQQRFSSLGEVLDLGLHMDGRLFYGSGYVVLNLNSPHPITESLSRELPWPEEGRKLLLKWDDMPQYCRYCQGLDHCKADCAELRNLLVCHTCNDRGHLSKQCRRNNASPTPNKVIAIAEMKPRKSSSTKISTNPKTNVGSSSSPSSPAKGKEVDRSQPPKGRVAVMSGPTSSVPGSVSASPVTSAMDTAVDTGGTTTLSIATLNCRSLVKLNNPSAIPPFLRYLRTTGNDIFVVQETHVVNEQEQDYLNILFQAKSSIWTQHCGIISTNPDFILTSPPTFVDPEGRYILTSITSSNNNTPIAYVLGIYAPATRALRPSFFASLANNNTIRSIIQQCTTPTFILGDFNYDIIQDQLPSRMDPWIHLLQSHFIDCFQNDPLPTFLSTQGRRRRLDYIYCSDFHHPQIRQIDQGTVPYKWTDHSLLSIHFCIQGGSRGPGNWKANPFLAKVPAFRRGIHAHIQHLFDSHQPLHLTDNSTDGAAQAFWDELKEDIAQYSKSFQLDRKSWLSRSIKKLLSKRNRILRDYKNTAILSTLLPSLEALLHQLQEEHAQIEILKAGKLWREQGERSPGLFKRLVSSRAAQQDTPHLYNSQGTLTSTHAEKVDVVHQFYTELYSPDPPNQAAIDHLLGLETNRDNHLRLNQEAQDSMVAPFEIDEIIAASKRHPSRSSPGSDHLPYEILGFLVRHPAAQALVLHIYNQALSHAIFPVSWGVSILTLLPKKGDPAQIGNHRPLQLVNCDNKIFTRLLNSRIMSVADNIINPYQQGFMPGRNIADNGLLAQMILEDSAENHAEECGLGLLLDQQKAYDRVNLDYLKTVLLHYGFPVLLVNVIYTLFKHNEIVLNINGYLATQTVRKLRGLKQGDPISCILYNFGLEPLLRSILHDSRFQGFTFHQRYPQPSQTTMPIKLLSYADDTLVFLRDTDDLRFLVEHLNAYSEASNAKINFHKTRAISLSGVDITPHWLTALAPFDISQIWTTRETEAITYLGDPLSQGVRQRQLFFGIFIQDLRQTAELHSRRGISLYGRATIVNSLIVSKCWYVFSVLPTTMEFLRNIRSIITAFVNTNITPSISWDLMVTDKSKGGLGIIDVFAQQKALYYRWLDPILFSRVQSTSIANYIRLHVQNHLLSPVLDIGLLFPTARSSLSVGTPISTITMIFRTMDAIPRDFSHGTRNPIECLLLPIPAIIASTSSYKLSTKLKSAVVGDIFELQATGFFLTPIPADRLPRLIKFVAQKFHNALARADCLLHPFFRVCLDPSPIDLYNQDDRPEIQAALNFASFRKGLHIKSTDPPFLELHGRTKAFRQMVVDSTTRKLPKTEAISSSSWLQFWALFLNHSQRNVLYRFIYNKIPTKLLRHQFNASNDPRCSICLTVVESTAHFFFYCEVKESFWERLILEYLWPGTTFWVIINALSTLNFHAIEVLPQKTSLPSSLVLIVAVAEIWRLHWKFIFDDVPFTSDTLFLAFQRSLLKLQAEESLSSSRY